MVWYRNEPQPTLEYLGFQPKNIGSKLYTQQILCIFRTKYILAAGNLKFIENLRIKRIKSDKYTQNFFNTGPNFIGLNFYKICSTSKTELRLRIKSNSENISNWLLWRWILRRSFRI